MMRRKAAANSTVTHDGSGKSSTTPPLFASRSSMSKNGSTAAASHRKNCSSSRPPTPAMQCSPSSSHIKKPLMPLLRRHRSAGSSTSDVTRETLAETSSTGSSAAPLYGNNNSGCSTSSGMNSMSQQQQHFCGAARSAASRRPSATSISSSNSYYYSSSASCAAGSHFQYLPCETERHENADDDRSIRTGPIDVDEMVPLVDVPSTPKKLSRRVACPIDLDDVESELLLSDEDDDDDSSNAIFILEGDDLDEEDFDQRLMGYVFTFEPEVIYELPPLPLNNYAARRKFSHEAIPQPIHERKSCSAAPSSSLAWTGPASLSVQSKRTGTLTSSSGASQMSVSICHNCGGRNGECLGNKFCI